jgi:hypothetical protein
VVAEAVEVNIQPVAVVTRPPMVGILLTASCPVCRVEMGFALGGGVTIWDAWEGFWKAYYNHYDAVHADSWEKLAREAVRQWRLCGPLPGNAVELELRLARLEAKS